MSKQKVVKQLNIPESLHNYERRLRTFDREAFKVFEGKYISTYRIYSIMEEGIDSSSPLYCDAFVVYKICKEYGYSPLGVCSERLMNGKHVAKADPCVYIGKYCFSSKLLSSPFRILPQDKVYEYLVQ